MQKVLKPEQKNKELLIIYRNILIEKGSLVRHRFTMNLLGEYQSDIKTVTSLLGHSGLNQIEKYTRAVDSLKEKAVNSLPDIEL